MDNLKQLQYTAFTLLALVALLVAPLDARAQEEPGELFIGLKGGLNQSTFSEVNAESQEGFVGGVFFAYNFSEVLSGELDVFYSKKGATGVTVTGGKDRSDALDLKDAEVTLEYWEFPILLKLTAPIQAPVNIRGFAGPSFNVMRTATINGSETQPLLEANLPVEDRYTFFDVGGVIGGEIAVPLPVLVDEIAVDGRYQFGFVDVDEEQDFFMKNRTFTGTISLRFEL